MRLPLADTARLSSILGITHVAVGTVSGTPGHCALTYRLYALPARKPVGSVLTVTGTETQVLAGLPKLSQAMMSLLGLSPAIPPAAPEVAPEDFALLGAVPWGPEGVPSVHQENTLIRLAPRVTLAGLLAMNVRLQNDVVKRVALAKSLLAEVPDNPLAFAQIAAVDGSSLQFAALPFGQLRQRLPPEHRP